MSIKLTIGSAVYNLDESFLREHIEGIAKQLNSNTELLLIDDCSTDNSGEVCREYAEKHDNVRYINMEKNSGLSAVRNRTVEEAAGEWVFFADGDNLLSDHFVETALEFIDETQDIIILERLKFVKNKPAEQPCVVSELNPLPDGAGIELSMSCLCLDKTITEKLCLPSRAFYHAAWGALYRKRFLTDNNLLFPVGQKKAQDSVFNTKAYYYAKRIAYLPYVMYYYRNNPGGITRRYSENLSEVFAMLIGHFEECIETFYHGNTDVEKRYKNNRIMAMAIDYMRLNVFHKDNPKPKSQRKEDFLRFIDSEPYKSAIADFDADVSDRREWLLAASLLKGKKFAILGLLMRNEKIFYKSSAVYRIFRKNNS
ncbi:MAG: glycosyltransferase [Clostridiales bacterium]|nr:glycosyltransferase [Clostridiales bacterium]